MEQILVFTFQRRRRNITLSCHFKIDARKWRQHRNRWSNPPPHLVSSSLRAVLWGDNYFQFPPNFFSFSPFFIFLFDEIKQETSVLISPEGEKLREKMNWSLHYDAFCCQIHHQLPYDEINIPSVIAYKMTWLNERLTNQQPSAWVFANFSLTSHFPSWFY